MTSHIDNRLDIYGPSRCPICGDHKETIYAGERYQLTCRKHPGHPLYGHPTERPHVRLVTHGSDSWFVQYPDDA